MTVERSYRDGSRALLTLRKTPKGRICLYGWKWQVRIDWYSDRGHGRRHRRYPSFWRAAWRFIRCCAAVRLPEVGSTPRPNPAGRRR